MERRQEYPRPTTYDQRARGHRQPKIYSTYLQHRNIINTTIIFLLYERKKIKENSVPRMEDGKILGNELGLIEIETVGLPYVQIRHILHGHEKLYNRVKTITEI